jgi:hypothetical protein
MAVLFPIPGNHDLVRPAEDSSISIALGDWHKRKNLHDNFWTDADSEYRVAVDGFFKNYTAWLNSPPVPLPANLKRGLLPGDIAARIPKGSTSLAVVGLNSTFLQLRKGNLRGELDISVYQLNAVCDGDPDGWLGKSQVATLLTHQPVSWLSKEAQAHFNREIYTPGRFYSHLYGHQHQVEVSDISMGGGEPKRSRQAPSLFGLDKYEEEERIARTHGYIGGRFEIDNANVIESLWPRRAEEGMGGNLRLRPDQRFDLNEEGFISTRFEISNSSTAAKNEETREPTPVADQKVIDILGPPIDSNVANDRLAACPQIQILLEPQHAAIRQEEQAGFEHSLLQKRVVYVVAGWGVGQDGFIGSALARFRPKIEAGRIYHIKCEDAIDLDSFLSVFLQQSGMPLQTFVSCVANLDEQYILFDSIGSSLVKGPQSEKFRNITQAILEYCPKLRIVIVSDARPDDSYFDFI